MGNTVDEIDVGAQDLMALDEVIETALELRNVEDAVVRKCCTLVIQREVRLDEFVQPDLFLVGGERNQLVGLTLCDGAPALGGGEVLREFRSRKSHVRPLASHAFASQPDGSPRWKLLLT